MAPWAYLTLIIVLNYLESKQKSRIKIAMHAYKMDSTHILKLNKENQTKIFMNRNFSALTDMKKLNSISKLQIWMSVSIKKVFLKNNEKILTRRMVLLNSPNWNTPVWRDVVVDEKFRIVFHSSRNTISANQKKRDITVMRNLMVSEACLVVFQESMHCSVRFHECPLEIMLYVI